MRRIGVIGPILTALVLSACGGGGQSEMVETSSGAPPRLVNLKGTFEQQFRKRNNVSALSCEDGQQPDVMAAEEVWNCDLTLAQTGHSLKIEVLVGVSTGDYSVLDCRIGPHQRYEQAPQGICKRVR